MAQPLSRTSGQGERRGSGADRQQGAQPRTTGRETRADRHRHRKATGNPAHRAKTGAGRQAATPGAGEQQGGGQRRKADNRHKTGQRTAGTPPGQTQGGATPGGHPATTGQQHGTEGRNETGNTGQSGHRTPPQKPESPPRNNPDHQRESKESIPEKTTKSNKKTNKNKDKKEKAPAPDAPKTPTQAGYPVGGPPFPLGLATNAGRTPSPGLRSSAGKHGDAVLGSVVAGLSRDYAVRGVFLPRSASSAWRAAKGSRGRGVEGPSAGAPPQHRKAPLSFLPLRGPHHATHPRTMPVDQNPLRTGLSG